MQITSPHLGLVAEMSEEDLYRRTQREQVPFFQWGTWLQQTINLQASRVLDSKKDSPSQTSAVEPKGCVSQTKKSPANAGAKQKVTPQIISWDLNEKPYKLVPQPAKPAMKPKSPFALL